MWVRGDNNMALSGIQIYKLLPQTNCKECGYPTCLAFAMKLANKQAELSACPYASDEAKAQLAEAAAPPVRGIVIKGPGGEAKAGNETVLFRHEKTFYNCPGLFLRLVDSLTAEEIKTRVAQVEAYKVDYVGVSLSLDGFAIQSSGEPALFRAAIETVRSVSQRPLILIADIESLKLGMEVFGADDKPLIAFATAENWQAMAALAKESGASLAVQAASLDEMVQLSEKVKGAGVEDLVLCPTQRSLSGSLTANTILRRLALKKNFRPAGFPILSFPGEGLGSAHSHLELTLAAQAIAKYSGFVVLDHFTPESAYALLVLRQNIYTDPQKPIQMQPGLYEINSPSPQDPLLVTTNFSITYFSVANEVEGAGLPAWLLVTDAEGMSVLTAWAAGKFNPERIAKDVRRFNAEEKLTGRRMVIPGDVAVISGELEEQLPGWEIKVGPREAVDLPAYMKQVL
jgi:acetyl-CoA decarbonylase/synthase complex subunit gamma